MKKELIRQEWQLLRQDKMSLALFVLLPVVLVVLFGSAVRTDIKGTRFTVVDPYHSPVTQRLTERFSQNPYFVYCEDKADLTLVFLENDVQILVDGSDNQAVMRASYAQRLLQDYQREMMMSSGLRPVYQVVPNMRMLYNPMQRGDVNIVPGCLSLIMLIVCALMGCSAFVVESLIPLCSISIPEIFKMKFAPRFIIATVDLILCVLAIVFLLKMPCNWNLLPWFVVALFYLAACLCLGMLFGLIAKNSRMALILSGMVMLGLSILLCGMMFPVDSMPNWLQWVAAIIPARWFTGLTQKLMIQNIHFQYVWKETVAILVMLLVFFAGTMKNLQKKGA